MSSQAPAYVRTGAPIVAGPALVALARALGVELTSDQLLFLVPAVSYAYYVLGRTLEHLNPTLGYVLGIAKQPAYSSKPPPQEEPELAEEREVAEVYAVRQDAQTMARPEQTDNRPRPEDGEQLLPDERGDHDDWTGEEMR